MRPKALVVVVLVAAAVCAPGPAGAGGSPPVRSLMRVESHLLPDARVRPHLLLMTLGGTVYCGRLFEVAAYLDASLVCPDYYLNGERSGASRSARVEDWGDPRYLNEVAALPARLRAEGVRISGLVLIGASYAGYANAELVATHPWLRPRAMIMVDSFFDLGSRYEALPPTHETRLEMEKVLGGPYPQLASVYESRSPSSHLEALAGAMRAGMRFVNVWSTSPAEDREFNGATCSKTADALWMSRLATLLGRPLVAYVTQLAHGDAVLHWSESLSILAGLHAGKSGLPGRPITFRPGAGIPADSYCA